MKEYLLKDDPLSKQQSGFRAAYSTIDAIDALLYCSESFRKSIHNNKIVDAALFDLSKVFDSINHNFLQLKIENISFFKRFH